MASPNRVVEYSPLRPDGAAIVKRIAGGDAGALAALYDSTCGLIYGLLLRILGSSAAAEQVLVAVYQGVWEEAAAYDEERAEPMTWLITMAHGRAIARLRADGQNEEGQSGYSKIAGRVLTIIPDTDGLTSERQRIVRSTSAALPPVEQRMIEFLLLRPESERDRRAGRSTASVCAGGDTSRDDETVRCFQVPPFGRLRRRRTNFR